MKPAEVELGAAVTHHRYVRFEYDGLPRVVEPHVLGRLHGKLQLLAYQVDGASRSGKLPRWRRFDVDRMRGVAVEAARFPAPRPPESGEPAPFDEVLASVEATRG